MIASITVGQRITVEQLIESRKVMTISKAMIIHIGITSETSRPILSASTTITPHIDRYLIRLQRIYNFLWFHAIILSTLDVLYAFYIFFWD